MVQVNRTAHTPTAIQSLFLWFGTLRRFLTFWSKVSFSQCNAMRRTQWCFSSLLIEFNNMTTCDTSGCAERNYESIKFALPTLRQYCSRFISRATKFVQLPPIQSFVLYGTRTKRTNKISLLLVLLLPSLSRPLCVFGFFLSFSLIFATALVFRPEKLEWFVCKHHWLHMWIAIAITIETQCFYMYTHMHGLVLHMYHNAHGINQLVKLRRFAK